MEDYEGESGQKLNKEKTSLFFSKNTPRETKEYVQQKFEAQIIQHHEKYLGLPPLIRKGKRKAFNCIKDQVGRDIAGWKGRLLSNAGREVLIKVVAQVTPTYTMSCFKLPNSLSNELNSMMSNFWWGQKEKERKMAWMSWKKMCTTKEKGGIGFKDLKAFNLALLAKQGWRILTNQNSLVHRIFKEKHFAKNTFLEAELGRRPSYAWRSIMVAREIVGRGLRWAVGNGEKVSIWNDRWFPTLEAFKVVSPKPLQPEAEIVVELINIDKRSWDVAKIRRCSFPTKPMLSLAFL